MTIFFDPKNILLVIQNLFVIETRLKSILVVDHET